MSNIFHNARDKSWFVISAVRQFDQYERPNTFKIIWCRDGVIDLKVDLMSIQLDANQVLFVAPNQVMEFEAGGEGLIFQYNRDFYCLLDHDKEISCIGLLYYGTAQISIIDLDEEHQRKFNLLLQVFEDEFATKDNIQEEMLRMLLKRLIILSTRLFKEQSDVKYKEKELDVIREFHVLVELNFKEKQKVADYAALLNKSPKTLSNLFTQNGEKPPLRQIQERIALEAKRLLLYTDKSIKEIGWELNFEEDAHFSRFFKRLTGLSPSTFRKQSVLNLNKISD